MEKYKYVICAAGASFGGHFGSVLGGWDIMLKSLVILMTLDYISGMAAAITGKSPKTENGRPDSRVGFRGLVKKGVMLIVVTACAVLDRLIGSECFVRNSCIVGFCVNEILSLTENAALFGIDIPEAVNKGLEIIRSNEKKRE